MRYTINENGCWIFNGPLDKDGYGKVSFRGKSYRAHRVMAHLAIKALEFSFEVVAHKCDNPSCINPEHLFITTAAGNNLDRDIKKRGACGELHNLAKLNNEQVRNIRSLYAEKLTVRKIADLYPQMTYGGILAIVSGKTWKNLV